MRHPFSVATPTTLSVGSTMGSELPRGTGASITWMVTAAERSVDAADSVNARRGRTDSPNGFLVVP